ncbi:MAG: hypothetical protein KDJ65_37790, partial [Anaerolineae bacterium]|nr:hypothetical protein [Anaerolineae bacterium]
HLADAHIEGNPESVGSDELHQRALTIVDPIFQQDFEAAVSRFNNLSSTDQTSSDIQQIVPAAHYGRIDTLFVTIDDHQWGRFDPDTNTITLQQNPQPQNVDLLDLATMQTLLNSGVVFPVEPSDSAELTPLAAIFRY